MGPLYRLLSSLVVAAKDIGEVERNGCQRTRILGLWEMAIGFGRFADPKLVVSRIRLSKAGVRNTM